MFARIYSTNNVIFIFLFKHEIEIGMSNEHEHYKMGSTAVLIEYRFGHIKGNAYLENWVLNHT